MQQLCSNWVAEMDCSGEPFHPDSARNWTKIPIALLILAEENGAEINSVDALVSTRRDTVRGTSGTVQSPMLRAAPWKRHSKSK